ncbi:MAG: 4-hydroxyphenylacetate 3-hydroxylase C-terminal domain-containing protein [Dehalococcoidia bacterium]
MNMVSDLTTGDFGGYHTVSSIHAEGSLRRKNWMIVRAYDARRTLAYARELAGLEVMVVFPRVLYAAGGEGQAWSVAHLRRRVLVLA